MKNMFCKITLLIATVLLTVNAHSYLVPGDNHGLNPYQPQPAPYYPNNPYEPGPGYGGSRRVIVRCENFGPSPSVCYAGDRIQNIQVVRQLSNAACVIGANVRIDRSNIIVMDGCRADFEVLLSSQGGGYPQPPYNPIRTTILQCDSDFKLLNSCAVNGRIIDVQLVSQRSNAPCELGRSWGYDQSRVWVDRGCRASFRVTLR